MKRSSEYFPFWGRHYLITVRAEGKPVQKTEFNAKDW